MKIVLLGLEFANANLGCQALAYSFAEVVDTAAKKMGITYECIAVVFSPFEPIIADDSNSKITSLRINYKSLGFWHDLKKLFKESDLIVDFTGGDSFSDIYGNKRFRLATLVKYYAVKSKTPVLLGPQTYGPYRSKLNKKFASYIIKKSKWVFARDLTSANLAKELSNKDVEVTLDVAFRLPYNKKELNRNNKTLVGLNISGFLWEGGYNHLNNVTNVDYHKYCEDIMDYLLSKGNYQLYLIPHVGTKDPIGRENDLAACLSLKEKYPEVIVVNDIRTPMDAKSIISAMDIFIGARMHATIAAISSGVATIPFSYSRKFEGLFNYLNYPYVISGRTETTEAAIVKTEKWIENVTELNISVKKSLESIQAQKDDFLNKIIQIFHKIIKRG